MLWDWNFVWTFMPMLLRGVWVTVEVTVVGSLIAVFVGVLISIARIAGGPRLRRCTAMAVQFMRGTPLLVQLYVIFFVLPDVGITLPAFVAGVVGLGLHYACYTSEVFRAGVESLPPGQWDAAKAIDLTLRQTWQRVVLPQSVPKVIPPLGNYIIGMMKEAALLSAISVHELLSRAQAVGNESYRYTEPLTVAGLIFLCLTILATTGQRWLETKFRAPHD